MMQDLIPRMLESCKDSRSCNKFLREHGFRGVRIHAIPTREARTIYGLFVRRDGWDLEVYRSDSIRDCITALGYY